MKIAADQLAKVIAETLEEYRDATYVNMENAVDKVASDTVSNLKATSPRRTGKYAKSWAHRVDRGKKAWAYRRIVYSKDPHYRLTHLLEHGHKKVNGGMVAARPHIAKVEQEAIDELVKEIKQSI